MIFKPNRGFIVYTLILLGSIIVLTSFQNCGTQDYSETISSALPPIVDEQSADGIPFAFDYRVNQITYMSCSHSNDKSSDNKKVSSKTHLNSLSTFFTFKIGSYMNSSSSPDAAGLTFRQEFIDYVMKEFSYKGALPSDTNIQNSITNALAHGGAALQFAIRDSTPIAYSVISVKSSGSVTENIDYDLFPQGLLLTSNDFLAQLLQQFKRPLPRLAILGTSDLQKYPLEGALHFESEETYYESLAQELRTQLMSETAGLSKLLTVTFSKDLRIPENLKTSYEARSTGSTDSNNRVWGTGFKVKFNSASPGWGTQYKNNVLSSINESNLSTFSTPNNSPWSCPAYLQYVIVSPQDRVEGGTFVCKDPVESTLTLQQANDLAILRRHLPKSDWIVDPIAQCVSPRLTSLDCYANRSFKPIDYLGTSSRCGISDTGEYLPHDCAEFVSVCIRN